MPSWSSPYYFSDLRPYYFPLCPRVLVLLVSLLLQIPDMLPLSGFALIVSPAKYLRSFLTSFNTLLKYHLLSEVQADYPI